MVAVHTLAIPLGFKAPDFALPEPLTGKTRTLDELKGEKGTVVVFMCNHCPYVKHIIDKLVEVAREYIPRGIAFIAVNSNDVDNYPEDAPDKMARWAREKGFPFPYLYDETQQVAKAYRAMCTPDFDVFDADLRCVYRGRFDASTPGNNQPVTGEDLRRALDALLEGRIVEPQHPSIGCNIKWKSGNEPEYFNV